MCHWGGTRAPILGLLGCSADDSELSMLLLNARTILPRALHGGKVIASSMKPSNGKSEATIAIVGVFLQLAELYAVRRSGATELHLPSCLLHAWERSELSMLRHFHYEIWKQS